MDTLEIAVIIGLCLKMALTVFALTIVYKMRLSSSKGTRKLKRAGGQREESAREEKTESQPVLKSSSGRDIHKPAISSSEKPLKPGAAANVILKQVQPKNTAPVKSSEPRVALKDDSVKHTAFVGAPQPQAAFTVSRSGGKPPREPSAGNTSGGERKRLNPITSSTRNKAGEQIDLTKVPKQVQTNNTAPIRRFGTKGPLKPYSSSKHISMTGTPQEQSAITKPKSVEKPLQEPLSENTSPTGENNDPTRIAEPTQIVKASEAGKDTGPGTEVNQASPEPPAETMDSGETDKEKSQTEKSGLGDLADLFATSASEFTEKNRLAEEVNDVDVNEILQEGLGLLSKVKKSNG